jgi:hypothetical protein
MEAGGDKDGLGTLFESGLRCVCAPSPFSRLILLLSIGSIVAQIPYVLPFLVAVTGKSGPIQRAEEFSRGRVLRRLETGASRKDLFYHLVSRHVRALERNMFTYLDGPITEWRGAFQVTAPLCR